MPLPNDMVPITVYLDKKCVEQIDDWAGKLGHSRSKLTRFLLEDAVSEFGWEYKVLTSRVGLKVIDVIRAMSTKSDEGEQAGAVPAA